MKKILLIALGACLFVSTADAQKQAGGEKNLQVLFAPLGGSPITLNGGGISFRKFNATGDAAYRLNFFFGLTNKTEVLHQADSSQHIIAGDAGSPQADKRTSGMTFSLRPGYEKHFAGTEHLSPYIGAELVFTMTTSTVETDTATAADYTNTAATWQVYTTTQKGKGASTTFGLNLVAGFDYYIAKSLSLGGEFGFGWATTSMPDIENERLDVKSTVSGANTTVTHTVVSTVAQKQGSSWNIGPNVIGQLKLSWLF